MKKILITIGILFLLTSINQAQDKRIKGDSVGKPKPIYFSLKAEANTVVYIDGVKYDVTIMGLLDPKKIESVTILTGEAAEATYHEPKVVVITSKKNADPNIEIRGGDASEGYDLTEYKGPMSGRLANDGKYSKPIIIIDGETRTMQDLQNMSPENIIRISILKDSTAWEKYNTKDGVILITTKKKKN